MDYRDALALRRLVNIHFYTSNTAKLLQARLMFGRKSIPLRHFAISREPYEEDYSSNTETLLRRAVQQIATEFGVKSCFFIEDTSLRLEALSDVADNPGMKVKEWFSQTSFESLDRELKARGNDRRAVVKSDIALHIPGLRDPIILHDETSGTVAATPPSFDPQIQYPWLTPATFNGWFVPDGQIGVPKRLGEMELEESWRYDFRAKNFENLIDRYVQLAAAANLSPGNYTIRRVNNLGDDQLELALPGNKPTILVIGLKCAGKSTFGDIALMHESCQVFEASSFFRAIAADHGFSGRDDASVRKFLGSKVGWDAVAKEATRHMTTFANDTCIVTGLRTVEELLHFQRFSRDTVTVLVEADARLRFERHIRRAREQDGGIALFADFVANDDVQKRFGLLEVGRDVADHILVNDDTIERYIDRIRGLFKTMNFGVRSVHRESSEVERSLRALDVIGSAATCEEISEATGRFGKVVMVYNTNRALKSVPEFADRIVNKNSKLRYKLTPRGRAFLSLLDLK